MQVPVIKLTSRLPQALSRVSKNILQDDSANLERLGTNLLMGTSNYLKSTQSPKRYSLEDTMNPMKTFHETAMTAVTLAMHAMNTGNMAANNCAYRKQ